MVNKVLLTFLFATFLDGSEKYETKTSIKLVK